LFNASNGKSNANVLALSFTGPVCVDPTTSDLSFWGDFIVLSSSSSGRFASAIGSGQINLFSNSSGSEAYLTSQGDIDIAPP